MLNRRYALLGWAVWRVGKIVAKRRAKAMLPSRSGESRAIGIAPVIAVIAALAAAGWFFFRRGGGEDGAELPE